jgi:hypothetical protein
MSPFNSMKSIFMEQLYIYYQKIHNTNETQPVNYLQSCTVVYMLRNQLILFFNYSIAKN